MNRTFLDIGDSALLLEITNNHLLEIVSNLGIDVYVYSVQFREERQLDNGVEDIIKLMIEKDQEVQAKFILNSKVEKAAFVHSTVKEFVSKKDIKIKYDDLIRYKKTFLTDIDPRKKDFELIDSFKHFRFKGQEIDFRKKPVHAKVVEFFYENWPNKKEYNQKEIFKDIESNSYEGQMSHLFKGSLSHLKANITDDEGVKQAALFISSKNGFYKLNI
jgi:hypothetical protein